MNIDIMKRSRIKEFSQKLCSRAEDLLFFVIQKLPEKFIPQSLMEWLGRYLDRRIADLESQSIKMTWQNMYLQNAVDSIHIRQQYTDKASSDC